MFKLILFILLKVVFKVYIFKVWKFFRLRLRGSTVSVISSTEPTYITLIMAKTYINDF